MKNITGTQLNAVTRLHRQTAYVTTLTEHVIMGGASNRHQALELLPAALVTLQIRLDAAIAVLDVTEVTEGYEGEEVL